MSFVEVFAMVCTGGETKKNVLISSSKMFGILGVAMDVTTDLFFGLAVTGLVYLGPVVCAVFRSSAMMSQRSGDDDYDENEDENKKLMQIQADTKAVGTAKKAAIMSRAEMKRAFNQRNQDLDKVLNPGEHNDRRRLFNSFKSYADSPKRPPQYSRNMYRKTDPSEFLAPRQKMAAEQRNSNLDDLKGWYDGHAVFKKLKAKKIALKRPPPVPMKAPPPGGVPKPRPVLRRQ